MSADHSSIANDSGFASNGLGGFTEAQQQLNNFWNKTMEEIKTMKPNDFKAQELPLARIKKIMKLDEDVKMISAEAPVLFAKAAEIFINELTLRSWIHAEENKRRTLQRNDIAMAITKYDQFDFLIDIVPRDEIRPAKRLEDNVVRAVSGNDQVQYLLQMAQQHPQASVQQATVTLNAQGQPIQLQTTPLVQQQLQLLTGNSGGHSTILSQPTMDAGQAQVIQVQSPAPPAAQPATLQVYTQMVSANGEIQNIPIQLTPSQMQSIALQMQGKQPGQQFIIQTAPADQTQGPTESQQSQPLFQMPIFGQLAGQLDGDQTSDRDV